ncbi:hypothetical protein J6590_008011 [Homalodisca vitripennis]|nr:hypothetical protein J6590_008011 [Homalodisca vitripennis]
MARKNLQKTQTKSVVEITEKGRKARSLRQRNLYCIQSGRRGVVLEAYKPAHHLFVGNGYATTQVLPRHYPVTDTFCLRTGCNPRPSPQRPSFHASAIMEQGDCTLFRVVTHSREACSE